MSASRPVLWHLRISHYSEKVRWALAYKGIEHERRAPYPGVHMAVAMWLTRGRHVTFPVLQLDGRGIGDSTAIIAALEERYPDPTLYPEDPEERRRALQLEDFFDEELGPHIRLYLFHEVLREPERVVEAVERDLPARLRGVDAARRAFAGYASTYAAVRFRVKGEGRAAAARDKVLIALDRLEAELGDAEHLVGERFSVADLTAAALFYPLVLPAEGPRLTDPPAPFEEFRAPLKERPGYRWVEEMFRRHRRPAEVAAAA